MNLQLLTLLLACSPATDADTPSDGLSPTPYIYDDAETAEPSLSLSEIGAAVQQAIDDVRGLSAGPLRQRYVEMMQGEGDSCPAYYSNEEGTYWADACTSSAGTTYQGYSFYRPYDDEWLEAEQLTVDGWVLYGGATIRSDSASLELAGGAARVAYTSAEGTWFESSIQGSFSWDGPDDGSWLSAGITPDLYMAGWWANDPGAPYFVVSGGVGGLGEAGEGAASFDDVILIHEDLWAPCPEEADGTVSIRGSDGRWYDVIFEGGLWEDPPDPEDCDGCGTAYFQGEPMGEVCADFSALVDWEETPW